MVARDEAAIPLKRLADHDVMRETYDGAPNR